MAGSHRTSELKVPTMSVGVRLALVAASPSAVEMFLPEVPGRSHQHMLDDLAAQLASDARFVPVRTANRVRLIAKHAIAWIAVARYAPEEAPAEVEPVTVAMADEPLETAVVELAPVDPPVELVPVELAPVELAPVAPAAARGDIPEELTLFDHQHFVEVELGHGGKLIGTLLDSESADFSRLGDHLNRSGFWLRLWTPDQHYLINARQVVAVTELGEVW